MTTAALSPHRPETSAEAFTVFDRSFRAVLGAAPQLLRVVDVDAHEGPVYVPHEDALYFTSVPRPGTEPGSGSPQVAIKRLALDGSRYPLDPDRVTVVLATSNAANGMTAGQDGALLVCEQGTRVQNARISRLDPSTGETTTVVDDWRGLQLNSPNDIALRCDRSVWFTDPSYGFLQGFKPEPQVGDFLYRYDPGTGALTAVDDSFDKPNGLAFSPDHSVLYVTDSGANQEAGSYHVGRPHHVVAFDVCNGGRSLTNRRLLAVITPGFPDGIKVDVEGRVYVSSSAGVQVLSAEGDLLGQINLPGAVNFAFGGPDHHILYITTDTAVWAAVLDTKGA